MKLRLDEVDGVIMKDNSTYVLEDNNFLENLTVSTTFLKPGQSTRGHSHENQEEVYIFTSGTATMTIGEDQHTAIAGDMFLIPKGKFHKVENLSQIKSCSVTCIFEKYDRSGETAKYK